MRTSPNNMAQPLEARGVPTEQYQAYMDGGIFNSLESIPLSLLDRLRKGYRGDGEFDHLALLGKRKAWLLEPLSNLQPNSFNAFQEKAGPLLLGVSLVADLLRPGNEPKLLPYLFFDVSGRMVEVIPISAVSMYENRNGLDGYLLSLPSALAKSWLWRTGGWRIPGELPEHILSNRQLIGHPFKGGWLDTDDYLDSLGRSYKKQYLPKIVEMFPDTETNRNGIKRYRFQCFLDTRPSGVGGPVGDQFFVCSTREDQTVYHIHRGDVDNIQILHNPAEAIDRYCAHVLLRSPGEFDFSPWSEPFKV